MKVKPLVWKQRCRKDKTIVADRKIWGTKCGKYRVTFSHIRYGETASAKQKLSDKWYAEELNNNCWEIISEHKKKEPAQRACEKRHKQKEKDAAAKLERMAKSRKRRRRGTTAKTRTRTAKGTRGKTQRGHRGRTNKDQGRRTQTA